MNIYINDIIQNLKPCSFKYNGDDKTTFGFIAQDLLNIFPTEQFTIVKDNNGLFSVEYYQLIPFLLLKIKELDAKIKILENKNNE